MSTYPAQTDNQTAVFEKSGLPANQVVTQREIDSIIVTGDFRKLLGGDAGIGAISQIEFSPTGPTATDQAISNDAERISFKPSNVVANTRYQVFCVITTNTTPAETKTGSFFLDVM